MNNTVSAFALSGGKVYMGGSFTAVGVTARYGLAVVSATDASLDAFSPAASGSRVYSMLTSGSQLFIGGSFSNISSIARNNLVSFSTSDETLTSWNSGADNSVDSLAVSNDGTKLYVGDNFLNIAGQSRPYVVELSTSSYPSCTISDPDFQNHLKVRSRQ